MASDLQFVEYVRDQFESSCGVTHKRMFGEFGLFSEGRMFAMVCDNRLLFKATVSGREYIGAVVEALPYPGAKPCFLVESQLEDREWLSELARRTVAELPMPRSRSRTGKSARA